MTAQDSGVEQNNAAGKSRAIWGWVLLAPALFCCLSKLVVPTIQAFNMSLQKTGLPGEAGEFVGLENYTRLLHDQLFRNALAFTLFLLAVRLLIVAIVPLLLALVVNQFGRKVRIPIRLLYTLPVVLFAPVVVALTWTTALHPVMGLWPSQALADPQQARQTVLLIDMLNTLGLAAGIGLIVYLAALRTEQYNTPAQRTMPIPLVACWLVGLLATAALSLQSFSLIFVATRGGPANSTLTLGIYQYMVTFQRLNFGYGAAMAGINLLILAFLGVAAGLVVVWAGLKLTSIPWGKGKMLLSGLNKPLATILLVAILLVSLSIGALSSLPWFWNTLNTFKTEAEIMQSQTFLSGAASLAAYEQLRATMPLGRILINTVVPLTGAILFIQLPIAYMGAVGIGVFRPLRQRSEWLLILFSPWLFTGTTALGMTLSIPVIADMRQAGTLDTLLGLAPPILLSIPILFVLTLFVKGHVPRWEAAKAEGQPAPGAFLHQIILPSLPLATLLAGITVFWELQALLWPLIVAATPNQMTIMTALLRLSLESGMQDIPVVAAAISVLWLPVALLFFLFFGVFHIFYLDHLAITR